MNPITAEVVISGDHKLNLELELPTDTPVGEAVVTLIVEPKSDARRPVNRAAEIRGKYEGQIRMSEDFDEPLEDFSEYM